MEENAELWSSPDEESQKRTLKAFLKDVGIKYEENMTIEELRDLYIEYETGSIKFVRTED